MSALFIFFLSLAFFFVLLSPVAAFTFTPGSPSECDNLPISWTGGTPPFQLLLSPVFGRQQNISIPASSFNNGTGSFSMILQMVQDTQLLLTMSDATGFNTGGTTPVLTVGPSRGGSSCNTTSPAIAFSFQFDSVLTQCIPLQFSGYTGAVQPVTIVAFVPGGDAFKLSPPVGSTSFSWDADVAQGTSMMFSMTDSQGRPGGSSQLLVVGSSNDGSCLGIQSPSSTSAAPSPTALTSSSPSPSSGPSTTPAHGISAAAIAGTIIAVLVFLAVIIALAMFFLRRKRRASKISGNVRRLRRTMESEVELTYDPHQAPVVTPYSVPQNYDPGLAPRPYHSNANPSFDANPFQDTSPQSDSNYQMPSQYQHPPSQYYPLFPPDSDSSGSSRMEYELFAQTSTRHSTSGDSTSTSQRKTAATGATAYKPSRFVIHRDADDDLPQPNDDGVVELPPQYSERRRVLGIANPTPGLPGGSNAGHPPGKI